MPPSNGKDSSDHNKTPNRNEEINSSEDSSVLARRTATYNGDRG